MNNLEKRVTNLIDQKTVYLLKTDIEEGNRIVIVQNVNFRKDIVSMYLDNVLDFIFVVEEIRFLKGVSFENID